MRAILLAGLITVALHGEDAADIMREYSEHDASWATQEKNYTYQIRSEERAYDRADKLKSRNVKTLEYIYQNRGRSVKVIGKNDKPLSPEEALKEQEAIETRAASMRPNVRQLLDRYSFELESVEQLNGRPTWVISGQSRVGAAHDRTRFWVDQADYVCAKLEGEISMDFSTRFEHAYAEDRIILERIRIDEGVWLPAHALIRHRHVLPPFQRFEHRELEMTYSNYKKFQTESRVVDSSQVH